MTHAPPKRPPAGVTTRRLLRFSHRVLRDFFKNHGVLLAGGVGYNVLLSAVPMLALLSVLLTHVVEEQKLLEVMAVQAQHLAPAHGGLLLEAVRAFLDSRDVIGIIGVPTLLFFSSFAFRMLEESIAIIFHRPDNPPGRSFWVSAVLPFVFMLVLGVGLLALTLLVSTVNALENAGITLYLLSFIGVFALFSAIYKVLPIVHVSPRRALVGGLVAATLWEAVRLLLMLYFVHVSFVNAVYGSLGTIIVLLISLEIGAIILLLGAQVIAELERSARAGLPWHIAPED
jgi:membrane protein